MKQIVFMILFIITGVFVRAQSPQPLYHHAVSIEHSYIPGIFIDGAFIPDNIEYTGRITQKLYLQGGVFAQNADEIPGATFFTTGFAFYAGATVKFYLFRHTYFTPALNLYYDHYRENVLYQATITIGPTVAFEYFISDRLSLRLDAVNINIGIGLPNADFVGTVHRFIGIGCKYNFDLK